MQRHRYQELTDELAARLSRDDRVVGVVALGSMAWRDYEPDEWSDHDFFVVTRAGEQEAMRRTTDWLPRAERISLVLRETDHGLKVVYDDGHLLEYAVFDAEELALASVNRYRVLFDRGGLAERMEEVAERKHPPRRNAEFLFGMLVSQVLVGCGRSYRGEKLSGTSFVKGLALRTFVELVQRTLPPDEPAALDDLDPLRRFENAYPGLARDLDTLMRADTPAAGLGMLDLIEHVLRGRAPELPWRALDVVRERVTVAPTRGGGT